MEKQQSELGPHMVLSYVSWPVSIIAFLVLSPFFANGLHAQHTIPHETSNKWHDYAQAVPAHQAQVTSATRKHGDQNIHSRSHVRFAQRRNADCRLYFWQIDDNGLGLVANSQYAFSMRIRPDHDDWRLDELVLDRMKLGKLASFQSLNHFDSEIAFAVCPLYVVNEWLPDWIKSDRLQLIGWERLEMNKLKCRFNNRPSGKRRPSYYPESGWFMLDNDRFGLVVEYDVVTVYKASGRAQTTWKAVFGKELAGLPILTRAFKVEKGIDKNNSNEWYETEYTYEVSLEEPNDKDFTLSAFGLPEPKGITWKTGSKTWLWFVAGGIVCLVLVILFQRRAKKRETPTN